MNRNVDSKPFFSIIIPVYNSDKYLSECINSILNQDLNNYEIIIVNDGSSDNSASICDEYANNDRRIRVFHINNVGAGKARNIGIKETSGEYILFIDSDDFIEKNSLKTLYNEMVKNGKSDLYLLKGKKVFNSKKMANIDLFSDVVIFNNYDSKDKILDYLSKLSKFPGSPCTKVYKKSLLVDNCIKFTEGNVAEDLIFVFKAIIYSNTIKIIDNDYYYYRQDVNSSVTHSNINRLSKGISLFIEEASELIENNRYKSYYYSFIAYEYMILVMHYSSLNKETSKRVLNVLNKYKYILTYSKNKNVKITKTCIDIFGFKVTSYLLRVYKMIVK